jgi:L-iditol 2-dehydrogenase
VGLAVGDQIPKQTRAAVYEGNGTVVVRDVSLPPLGSGELLVRIRACGLCGSEALRWYADSKAPFVLGHEPVAEIVACGKEAAPANGTSAFKTGERVFIHHHAPCMTCRRCRRGDFVQCATWRASKLTPGALAHFTIVPQASVQHDVLRIPTSLSDEQATLVEPLATVVKSVRRCGMRAGDRVLIIGLGAMGMLHALVARVRQAELILGADRVPGRLEKATSLGIDEALDVDRAPLQEQVLARSGGEGADIVIVTPGSASALETAVQCVAPGGTIVAFTPLAPDERFYLDVNDVFFRDVNFVMTYSAGPNDTREALDLLAAGLPVDPLFTHRFSLEQAAQAYAMLKDSNASLKVIVYP